MVISRRKITILVTVLILLAVPLTIFILQQRQELRQRAAFVTPGVHPVLVLDDNTDIVALRMKANTLHPWKTIYTKAKQDCDASATEYLDTFDGPTGYELVQAKGFALSKILGACTLVYTIETGPLKSTARTKITTMMDKFVNYADQMQAAKDGTVSIHQYTADPSFALFQATLTLDTLYDDPQIAAKRAVYEGYLSKMITFFLVKNQTTGKYPNHFDTAVSGALATWGLYKADQPLYTTWANDYWNTLTKSISPDGVFKPGPGYLQARYATDRISKWGFMHIEEKAGSIKKGHFYKSSPQQDPRIKNMFEYMMHGAFAPNSEVAVFADTNSDLTIPMAPIAGLYAASRFSDTAGGYAAWREEIAKGINPNKIENDIASDILSFMVAEPVATSIIPKSRIYPDGAAVFWEGNGTRNDLYAQLWNGDSYGIDAKDNTHRHMDINALVLAGYGRVLLSNSGYNGHLLNAGLANPKPSSCDPATNGGIEWCYDYLHNIAWSNNTLTMNNQNHLSRFGEGIEESLLINDKFDYASGKADAVLDGTTVAGDTKYNRNLYMIHPQDGAKGYFVTIDEVDNILTATVGPSTKTVDVAWHPKSCSDPVVNTPDRLYQWEITKREGLNCVTDGNVAIPRYLSIFLATTPNDNVPIKAGAQAGLNQNSFVGKYIRPVYAARANGSKNVVTILYPQNSLATPAFNRTGGAGYTGGIIRHGNDIIDYAVEALPTTPITLEDTSGANTVEFTGKNAIYRMKNNSNAFYFVRQGTSFNDRASVRSGYASNQPVSLFMQGTEGRIATNVPAEVTFFYPGIIDVKVNGTLKTPIARSTNSVTLAFTSTTSLRHTIAFVTDTPPITPTHTPTATPTVTTAPPTPTPTGPPSTTALQFTMKFHGLGTGGDEVNPNSLGNPTPTRTARNLRVELYTATTNTLVTTVNGTVTYDATSGTFKGTLTAPTTITSGGYNLKVKSARYLWKQQLGVQIISEQQNTIPTMSLITGDINNDEVLDILDYNILVSCYGAQGSILPPTCLGTNNANADLFDDGNVNLIDLNLWLREFSRKS